MIYKESILNEETIPHNVFWRFSSDVSKFGEITTFSVLELHKYFSAKGTYSVTEQ